ncbi:dynein beta chain, ciliary-like [Hermetia illucens]|uniref:dynein beta chain, ciliary-like n=1 Tax=Hermetia illucens TaxID=343691 RepID=UPI0018CC2CBB|nr:dynein beta chain, ciliary-like [Hermetia illucens]
MSIKSEGGTVKSLKVDTRLDFIMNYIMKTMRLKQEKWNKMMATEEMRELVMTFLDDPNQERLIFTVTAAGLLTPYFNFPEKPKSKVSYFIRREVPMEITNDNIRMDLLIGDVSPKPLEDLSVLVDNVFLPILSNPQNHEGWTAVIEKDVQMEIQNLRNNIAEFKGIMINRTILPMPITIDEVMKIAPQIARGNLSKFTNAIKDSLESITLKWRKVVADYVRHRPAEIIYSKEANPVPQNLFEFWNTRWQNLENLADQFRDVRIKTTGQILYATKSIYFTAFKEAFQLILDALTEARDITLYYTPLKKFIDKFETHDFDEIKPHLKPLLHIICLVWANSKYHCTNECMILLFKFVHNMLINSATRSLDPGSLFQGEIDEALHKVTNTIQLLNYYKESYGEYLQKLETFKTDPESKAQLWTWEPHEIFYRLDLFLKRLEEIQVIFDTGVEILKLEKMEFGGLRGSQISREVQGIFEEYNTIYREWSNIQFDPLDPDPSLTDFEKERVRFKAKTDVLERKLGFQFERAFLECFEIGELTQLVKLAGSLLHRDIIKEQIMDAIHAIVEMFAIELDKVKFAFDSGVRAYNEFGAAKIPIDPAYPAISGTILWLRKLRQRLMVPYNDFPLLDFPLFENELGEDVMKRHDTMIALMDGFQEEIISKWREDVVKDIDEGMANCILRKEGKKVFLNFNDELRTALRDIKNLKLMGFEIPEHVLEFYERDEELWEARIKLFRIAEWYNEVNDTTHECELALVQKEIEALDEVMQPSFETITWINFEQTYINMIFEKVQDLHDRVLKSQANIETIRKSIRSWGNVPMYQRKDGNTKALLDIDDRTGIIERRFKACAETKELIQKVMTINMKLFFNVRLDYTDVLPGEEEKPTEFGLHPLDMHPEEIASEQEGGEESVAPLTEVTLTPEDRLLWRDYEVYVDEIVGNELIKAIMNSIKYLKFEMENRFDYDAPIFEVKMELQEPAVVYIPNIDPQSNDGFLALIENIIKDMYNMSDMIPRVAQAFDVDNPLSQPEGPEETYQSIAKKNGELSKVHSDITKKVKYLIIDIRNYSKQFNEYSYLWTDDKAQYLAEFKKYGRPLTDIEREVIGTNEFTVKDEAPTLDMYKEQINKFQAVYDKIMEWETFRDFGSWFRLDQKGFKFSVLNEASMWGGMFKQDLINRVVDALQELEDFIDEADAAMKMELDKDNLEGLLKIMNVLNQVNDRQYTYDYMFEPLREVVDVLRLYSYEFPEKVYQQFSDLPDAWMKIKKIAATAKQYIAPIQAYQVDLIEKRIILFDNRASMYRNHFLDLPFFNAPCEDVYEICDQVNSDLLALEEQYSHLNDSSALFELQGPDQGKLIRCRKELKMVKNLWDLVIAIETTIDDWKKTPWKRIDIDSMDAECKRFGKDLRTLDKDVRSWDPYIFAENELKNLLTSLRAVTELQNPAIRDRHWQELMQTTHVVFHMDDSTTLKDLLDLQLHNFEEEVKNIVDKSVKEEGMEKVIKDLKATWTGMEFDIDTHERTHLKLLKASEEMIEVLEDHQVQLQNLLSSKYIAHFLEEVTDWQTKLSNADQVIQLWFEVQRKWMYLESIFIGSGDIRSQLPEDSKRFDMIDREFRALLSQMMADRNVIRSTNKHGLIEKLEFLGNQLILCEKALNDYLDSKRLEYPRFYFVSSADLLDILSNGNNPELVARHLTKLYDSLAKLSMVPGTKLAKGMISKEHDEFVPFLENCDCTGKVEVWLNRVTDKMRETLRRHFRNAVIAYEEKQRHIWVFEWPAQPALCTTQIWWTTETNAAFAKLDMGYENALKDYQKKQINQLNALILLLLGDLTPGDRQKIMTICTIDVHSRDVVAKMIAQRVEQASSFQWQSQLRHRWDVKADNCFANICDAEFLYDYEYLGNTPRLVITPLTDRCYITLTQSLHLVMGGAPAGPAGTGKTETTKDLGRALGIMVYVFNCSEQMDYKSCGNIHKGLAQTGAWGCFDEFNRISVEVLSVVAVQVKTIQDAIKGKKETFNFLGEIIKLTPTVGVFITMNPGYAGRTELPENLKALYRPCAMVVPDFALICEIMLVAEGFQEARLLARKFITLYTLCKELLSKQDHYDWGLRAIKSVLVVAGSLRRDDRQRPEDQVLMRALRDFNIPKIVTDDVGVFMGLIGDLFPALDVPRKRNMDFEAVIKKSAVDLKLQPEDGFILKVVQLEELFAVRHSVFIIGYAGTGKSEVWKTLHKTYANQKRRPVYNDLNPKAVTNDELFGIVNPATREWKDGLFSVIMRDQANMSGNGPKWIVLDGDIDPMWIESLNTVMDDNKVLTLASNERIALTKEMRLLFEIANLKTATPATVSRAGILYINPQDLGWNPAVASWINTREIESEKSTLNVLFEKYVPSLLEVFRFKMKKITPISEIAMLQMTCYLLDCLLTPTNVPPDCPKEWYEIYFVFAIIWGFGSTLFQDQIIDWRNEFNKWWLNEFKTIKFPAGGNVFNFYVDQETKKFLPWTNLVPTFELDPDIPLQSTLVHTSETTRLLYFADILTENNHPVMFIGPPGSGKTVVMAAKLNSLSDKWAVTNVPFNFYTNSDMLQKILEKPLEKKAGRNYGPPGNKTMIYFIDDMNMPEVDTYGTVQPHTLIRQFMDYHHWYDRIKLSLKDIHKCQFVSCMNPTAGSFTINPRLQRHFCAFALNAPSTEAFYHVLSSILSQHLAFPHNKFDTKISAICEPLINTAIALHQKVCSTFLPTAVKFHYIFNLRDVSNIFTGMMYATGDTCPNSDKLLRQWVHEATRVYGDKMVEVNDIKNFNKLLREMVKKGIETFNEEIVFEEPLIFCHFAQGLADFKYTGVADWQTLHKLLSEAQDGYNELVGAMNLVLFEDAMAHICRISRILEAARGYALLIGVGGSGKQSLTRLASYISSLDVFQVQLRKDYGIPDLKADLAALYMKAGMKNQSCCYLMTDSQVAKEEFLVLVNDMLASGEIHELFADDEVENIISNMRNEVKQAGLPETRENCWKYFINKVRGLLKVVLCFSPVGSTLRVRARKFPALVNCTTIDWFHEWPKEALESVSFRFLEEIEEMDDEIRKPISQFMAYVHGTVNEMSQIYLQNDKRYNYTTPKSFLELIALYQNLLRTKLTQNKDRIVRLENGLLKLAACAAQVDGLQDVLKEQEVVLKVKNEAADKLIVVVSAENEKVQKERNFASEEEVKVRAIEEDVSEKAKLCEEDLRRAQPALIAAQEALNTLNKANLTELKSFGSPHEAVVNVCAAVLVLFSKKGKIPKDRSWKACKALMGKVDQFLYDLINYDKEHIHPDVIKALQPYLNNPDFDPEKIYAKSSAAAGLCAWVINIHKFYQVFLIVEPKQRALNNAQAELKAARDKLQYLNDRLIELEEKLNVIQTEFNAALAEKQKCQDEADKTAFTIDLAHRLIDGLATEKVRWRESVKSLNDQQKTLPGDILLIACFISYVGCFTRIYRNELQNQKWKPQFDSLEPRVPSSEGTDPFDMICDDAQIAEWNNQGLPSDRMSAENAAILSYSDRYPLMIDPQLQGIKWIKQKYGKELVVARLTQKSYLDVIEKAITGGKVMLLENIGESIDAVLDPLLGRMLIKKGTVIKIGDKEIDFNKNFRLILHTKLANPHYKPELQAQCTLINFTVTRDGLEDQFLAAVVKAERPDLEQKRTKLTMQQNNFKITLKFLEDDLLQRLSSAGENVLEDATLVLNLEKTKKTADEVEIKVKEAKITAAQIDNARENYRPAAKRASIVYFILNDLFKINPMYQFSLKAFTVVFQTAIAKAKPAEKVKERVENLIDSITFCVTQYTTRGLFERDKLIFLCQLGIQILLNSGEIAPDELDFLLKFPYNPNVVSPLGFLTNISWGGIKALCDLMPFRGLDKDIEGSHKRWQKFTEAECPEKEKFPGEWKSKTAVQRLCMMRALRPDRMTYAVQGFIEEKLGPKYVEARSIDFPTTFEESSPYTHIFFILSPGVDPLKDVEKLGNTLGFSTDNNNFYNVSLGQGQEIVAENAMDIASKEGHWVILQNIHLVARWLPSLEKKMEQTLIHPHENYRLFLSAEPAASAEYHILPQGILESAIKITNEPPTGMLANIHKALDNFNQETLEMCTKETEFKAVLFALCYFHAVVAERRKFGPQGWNRVYPFNVGDLTISVYVLYNYLEANSRVPWEDLRYLFGEIMYGGHITDDWDRRLCRTYLEEAMQPELIDGDLQLCKGFPAPPNTDYKGYHQYIDDVLPAESPALYGLHSNAEIGFLTTVAERLFKIVFELQPRIAGGAGAGGASQEEVVKSILDDIIDKLPQPFNMIEIMGRVEDRSPYVIVAFQECERMNILMSELRRSLVELELGLKGELTITSDMEKLMECLFMDQVPESWTKLAYPSLLGLQSWFADLMVRLRELENWSSDFRLPSSVWLGGFFNPQSFLTAIMQQTARKNEWPLDRMCLNCDVTKKQKEEISAAPREGAFVNGLYMEGARWDIKLGTIADARLKELFPAMPVIYIKAVTQDKQDTKNIYECPVYKIRMRGPTFVWTFNLKTKEKAAKWTLAGVCLLLQT